MEKTEKLREMVGYQQDSIVSRVIVDKKTGTITLFAFDVRQSLSEHIAPFDAMVYLVEGEAEITIDKGKFVLREGDMIVMPANIPHAVKATKRFKMLLVMIKS